MITIVFTYRNRDIKIVKKCFDSLKDQNNKQFNVTVINYGSNLFYTQQIENIVQEYSFINYIFCSTDKQLWNKSRAINIALKKCTTPYFFVADIDMIFRNDFIEKLQQLKSAETATYFQVGFLNEEESKQDKLFKEYKIKHLTSSEATGITLYLTEILKSINGYNEFYHGWGSEDTDVHLRLQKAGYKIRFYTEELLLLHQWHNRQYRSKNSKEPFHSSLELVNYHYLKQQIACNEPKVNLNFSWGEIPKKVNFKKEILKIVVVTNQQSEIDAILYGVMQVNKGNEIVIKIEKHKEYQSIKNYAKRLLGKKYKVFYNFQAINDLLLSHLISYYRNCYYEYKWNKNENTIQLKIAL